MRHTFEKTLWLANPFMLTPALGCLLLFFVIPMLATLAVSCTDWQMGGQGDVHFVGLSNYLSSGTVRISEKVCKTHSS